MSSLAREKCSASITVPSRVEYLRPASRFLVQASVALSIPRASDPLFETAIAEALTNALNHGNAKDPAAMILCELVLTADRFTVKIFDEGAGFSLPLRRELPDWSPAEVDVLPTSGFGLPIIQAVFPMVNTVRRSGRFGLELALPV
jgi:anti-sigma regulatory factor (Ser/Thr protein kinase)